MIHNAWPFWFAFIVVFTVQCSKLIGALFSPLIGRYATQVNLGVQSFGISPAIRFVLSANELFILRF
ncbi:hypothetical protein EAY04_20670, partial [Vibrio anguillarum]|uniref:hypothetical protein n=1 Tax=Vibrio anguillarum TaxID=55601 RepID=UPI001F17F6F4